MISNIRVSQMGDKKVKKVGDDYEVDHDKDNLGRGSFGDVKVGRTADGCLVAVKIATDQSKFKAAQNEIAFLMELQNQPNIVKLIGYQYHEHRSTPAHWTFAMELAECSLDKLMRDGANIRGLPQDALTDLVWDCCSGMKSLREKKVAHRDIKHLNILVFRCRQRSRKSTFLFKFCDLGNATEIREDVAMNSLVGTPNVLHPKLSRELTKGALKKWKVSDAYTGDEVDFWSLACTLFFAANGHYPFPNYHNQPSVYHDAVENCPKDSISATIVEGPKEIKYKYAKEIGGWRYPQWFKTAFSTLIRELLHNPKLDNYEKIARALVDSQEYTFLSLHQLEVVKYADVSQEPLLSEGHPSVRQVLGLPEGTDCLLFGDDDKKHNLGDLNKLNVKTNYMVLPASSTGKKIQINLQAKGWKTVAVPERYENLRSKEDYLEVRAAHIGEGFKALHDADQIYILYDTGKNILRQHLKKLRIKAASSKESLTYPLRFAAYGNCQCQAWFVQTQEDKKTALEGMAKSGQASKELTHYSNELDKVVMDIDKMLKWIEDLYLDEKELPGIYADLIRYVFCDYLNCDNYQKDICETTLYTRELVQRCFDRRTSLAAEFCGENDKSIGIMSDMLNGLVRILNMHKTVKELKDAVEDCAMMIELPFQEMKRRVEKTNSSENITQKDLRRSVAFHSGPTRIQTSAAEIKALAKRLEELTNIVKK